MSLKMYYFLIHQLVRVFILSFIYRPFGVYGSKDNPVTEDLQHEETGIFEDTFPIGQLYVKINLQPLSVVNNVKL